MMNVSIPGNPTDPVNRWTAAVIGSAIEIHRELGPGLLESTYEQCLAYECISRGLKVARQQALPLRYKSVELDCGYRLDLVVEKLLLVEIKSVSELLPVHDAQVLTYLNLARLPVGLLINFNVPVLKWGIRRFVVEKGRLTTETQRHGDSRQIWKCGN